MNKKSIKKILSIFLFVAFAFSTFSIIKAKAGTKAFTLTDASISDKSASVTANVAISGENVLSKVTFKNVNDYIVYKLTFKNNDSVDYTIKGITDNNTNENVKYEYEQYKDETIKAGATKDILVKVIYNKEVTDVDKRDTKDAVKLSFEIADPSGNTLVANTVINPKTNDGIGLYIVIAAISVIGITALVVKNRKAVKVLTMVALVVPFAAKAVESSFVIELNNELNLHDKALVTTEIDGKKVKSLVPYEQAFTKPADPVKEGYDFVGWFVGDQEYNFDTPLSDDVVITAKFNKVEYTVTFDPLGGTISTESIKVGKGESITVPSPYNRKGLSFIGWSDPEGTLVVAKNGKYTPEGNITLYAYYADGDDANLVDVNGDYQVSVGDIVNFGPEEFIIVGYAGNGDVKLLAKNPLGNNNGIKQVETNPITSKFSDSKYWLTYPSNTPSGWPNGSINSYTGHDVYDEHGSTVDRVNYPNNLASMEVYFERESSKLYSHGCLLDPTINLYETYLRGIYDFNGFDIRIMDYADAVNVQCEYNEDSTCDKIINNGYDFWLNSYMYYQDRSSESSTYNFIDEGKSAYFSSANNSIYGNTYDQTKTIRPLIVVDPSDIVAPWEASN